MIPAGYMAKQIQAKPDWLTNKEVVDIYSLSDCLSKPFANYIPLWRHNGFWFFDTPSVIQAMAQEQGWDLAGCVWFYYECYAWEFDTDSETWQAIATETDGVTAVTPPSRPQLQGFDVVTFSSGTSPECSPLSCNGLANELAVNAHCLLPSLEAAKAALESGHFKHAEPGPCRIFAVYTF